jgi:fumarate hydratase class II
MGKVAGPQEGRRAQPALPLTNETPVLTVIVPVYNEVRTIDELLRRVLAAPYEKQVIVVCGAAGGQFQLNVMMPVMADAVLESIRLLAGATGAFMDFCLADIEPNPEASTAAVEKSLSLATGLNPLIGYEQAAALAKEAFETGKTIRQICQEKRILPEGQLNEALDPWRMTRPNQ